MLKPLGLVVLALVSCLASTAPGAPGKMEEWTDTQGNRFRGEPVELYGPLALFRTGRNAGRRLPLRFLKEEDCLRLQTAVDAQPARASDWASAKAELSADLPGRVSRVVEKKLQEADLRGRPEPLLYVVFFASNGEGGSWDMLGTASQPYWDLQGKFPQQVEGVLYGLRHSVSEHSNMAVTMNVPYLVCDFYDQGKVDALERLAPGEGYALAVLSRHGVPVFFLANPDKEATAKVFADVMAMLELMKPENPKAWGDRRYYVSALQLAKFAQGRADPVLIGNPIMAEGLKQRKIYQFEAQLQVKADGTIGSVTVSPNPAISEKMAAAIATALGKAALVPAVENGVFVDGTYTYRFDVAP